MECAKENHCSTECSSGKFLQLMENLQKTAKLFFHSNFVVYGIQTRDEADIKISHSNILHIDQWINKIIFFINMDRKTNQPQFG